MILCDIEREGGGRVVYGMQCSISSQKMLGN